MDISGSESSPFHSQTCDLREVLVVADRLALLGLVLLAQVAAAGLVAGEGVAAHQLRELEEVGDPAGVARASG